MTDHAYEPLEPEPNGQAFHSALAHAPAALTTATVEVQVLKIGAKQMTLAVFRQLTRDDHISGQMWGTVNYCHRAFGCDKERHLHVVWQRDEILRHGIIFWGPSYIERRGRYLDALTRRAWRTSDIRELRARLAQHLSLDSLAKLAEMTEEMEWKLAEQWIREWVNDAEHSLPDVGAREYAMHERCWEEAGTLPQLFIAV